MDSVFSSCIVPARKTGFVVLLEFLGIELMEKQNATNEVLISAAASRVAVRVIHTDEEHLIAKSVCCVLGLVAKGELIH